MLTRFAPAPTGWLHLGHVVNAIYVWGLASRHDAGVLLRVEDHDRQRSRPEYERALLEDLDWLGFQPTQFGTDAFRSGACLSRQSERAALYAEAARTLNDRGLLYGCTCSRTAWRGAVHSPATHVCRHEARAPVDGVAWRLRLDLSEVAFGDLLLGPQYQQPGPDSADPIVRDRFGNWTYQFAVSVDDHLQAITLVIRGRDLLDSTGLQIQLAALLGRRVPATFAHHPLVMKSETQKLSKSDGDTGIRSLRSAGLRAEDVIGLAAARVGLLDAPRPLSARDAAAIFTGQPQ